MAYYGHLFRTPGQQGAALGEFTAEQTQLAYELVLLWLERAAHRSSNPTQQATAQVELSYLKGQIGTEIQGIGRHARNFLRSAARLRWFASLGMGVAERFMARSLYQVTRYLTDPATRDAAQNAILSLVGPETRLIIAHSLGSVVAYEAVHGLKGPLPLLITIGSSLGLDTIIYHRLVPQPPTFPTMVLKWVNISDTDDIVAATPDLTPMFSTGIPAGAVFESGYTVDNGAQPHSAAFYLAKVQLGRPVGECLSIKFRRE
jgi:hypothetical protein